MEMADSSDGSFVYEIVASEPPISIDASVQVKQVLLTPAQVERYDRLLWHFKGLLIPADRVGFVLGSAAFFASSQIRPWLAPLALLLQLPFKIDVLLSFRYDCARLLTQTFEWRFLLLSVVIWFAGFASSFQDSRVWVLVGSALGFMNASLFEALFKSPRGLLVNALGTIGFLLAIMAGLLLSLFGKPMEDPALLRSTHHSITMKDLLQSTSSTVFMLFCRLAYVMYRRRNRVYGTRHTGFTGYYFNIRLRVCRSPASSAIMRLHPNVQITAIDSQNDAMVSLRLASSYENQSIDAGNTLVPSVAALRLKPWQRRMLYLIGFMGIVTTFVVLCPWNVLSVTPRQRVAKTGLVCTILFCFWLGCHVQRQLFGLLLTNFHVMFLSVQITIAQLCACNIGAFEIGTCCALAACWIWLQCALVLDTICPDKKRDALGFQRTHWALPAMWLYSLVQTLGVAEILLENQWKREDPSILEYQWRGKVLRFQVVPFLFMHQVMILIWITRLALRSVQRVNADELVVLRGNVEYDALVSDLRRRVAIVAPKRGTIVK